MKCVFETHDGVELSLHELGAGRPFVFQHGLCGDAAQPGQVFPEAQGFRRITLECRGHGRSAPGPVDKFSIAQFTDDIAEMLERLIGEPVVIGGISMGAALALRLAVKRPDLIRGLVLARPAWVTSSAPKNMRANAIVGQLLRDHTQENARSLFEETELVREFEREAPDNLNSLRSFFTRQPKDITAELLCRISADGPGISEEQVRAIKVPTLVIGHKRDLIHPHVHAQKLAALIPKARLIEITPKATDANAYANDFRAGVGKFLKEL